MRKGLDRPAASVPAFYGVLAAAMLIGLGISLSGLNPIKALVYTAVINAVISVPIMVGVMLAASHPKVMGELVLSRKWKVVGWAATSVMAAAALAVLATLCT